MAAKLKKGDTVMVLSGKDKGKKGKIIRILETSVVVEKINIVHKHQKPSKNFQGGIIEKPMPLNNSKVRLVCPKCSDVVGVKFTTIEGRLARKCGGCNEIIEKVK